MSKSKTTLILARGREYLEMVQADPSPHPPEIKAMAEYVGVSRRLFYKADPDIQKLVSDLEELREALAAASQPLVLTAYDPDDPYGDTPLDELNLEIEKAVERAVWAAKKFVGQRSRGGASKEASLAAHDLGTCLGQLRAVQNDLRPLVDEWARRTGAAADQPPIPSTADDLFEGLHGDMPKNGT